MREKIERYLWQKSRGDARPDTSGHHLTPRARIIQRFGGMLINRDVDPPPFLCRYYLGTLGDLHNTPTDETHSPPKIRIQSHPARARRTHASRRQRIIHQPPARPSINHQNQSSIANIKKSKISPAEHQSSITPRHTRSAAQHCPPGPSPFSSRRCQQSAIGEQSIVFPPTFRRRSIPRQASFGREDEPRRPRSFVRVRIRAGSIWLP